MMERNPEDGMSRVDIGIVVAIIVSLIIGGMFGAHGGRIEGWNKAVIACGSSHAADYCKPYEEIIWR